jgi:hypothetical protein
VYSDAQVIVARRTDAPIPWPHCRATGKPRKQQLDYKVAFSHFERFTVRDSRTIDGQLKEIDHGPKASSEAMTRQFEAVAAEGWQYAGPVTSTGKQSMRHEASKVLPVVKRTT